MRRHKKSAFQETLACVSHQTCTCARSSRFKPFMILSWTPNPHNLSHYEHSPQGRKLRTSPTFHIAPSYADTPGLSDAIFPLRPDQTLHRLLERPLLITPPYAIEPPLSLRTWPIKFHQSPVTPCHELEHTIDPFTVATCQESNNSSNILWNRNSLQWAEVCQSLVNSLNWPTRSSTRSIMPSVSEPKNQYKRIGKQTRVYLLLVHVRLHTTRCNCIHSDALVTTVCSKAACETLNSGFASGIQSVIGNTGHCCSN